MSDQQVDEFLEHVGVKGMRWGVRNQELDRVNRVARGTELRNKRIRNLAIGVGGAAAVGVGALFAYRILQANRMVTTSMPGFEAVGTDGRKIVKSLGNNMIKVKVKDLPKLHQTPLDLTKIKYVKV